MTCRLEKQLDALLTKAGIGFTRPDRDRHDPTNLDFYLPDFNLYVEVKQYHSPRITGQLAQVPRQVSAIVLQGPNAVLDFEHLCTALGRKP
jgi:hypothetical protein